MKKSILTKIVAAAAVLISVSFASCNEKSSLKMKFVKMNGGKVTVSTKGAFEDASENNPIEVAPFEIADTEVTYAQWYEVYQWATSDERGANKYVFANYGREGSDGTDGAAPTENKNQPVTCVSWRDAVVWCNAASEKAGLAPVYKYNGNVLREAENYWDVSYPGSNEKNQTNVSGGFGKAENATVDTNANGYRLPTQDEWEFAARGGNPASKEWSYRWAGTDDEKALKDYAVYNTDGLLL